MSLESSTSSNSDKLESQRGRPLSMPLQNITVEKASAFLLQQENIEQVKQSQKSPEKKISLVYRFAVVIFF